MTPTLTTLVSFDDANGLGPLGSLIADANGDLFGTTQDGGENGDGTVFEIAKTAGGYVSAPTTLISFNDANGAFPNGSLIADANGDLFGTTFQGGANGDGTVFEIAKIAGGYSSTPTTLVSFNGTNGQELFGSLIADGSGDLFGATFQGGANGDGTVFEIAKTASGYASTPTTLVGFGGADGAAPGGGSLIADADGDLFGTTLTGGPNNDGTVFEIAMTGGGYASTPTTLVSFNKTNGGFPNGGLIADANGDLFGTTSDGGANDDGTVFEIKKTATGYASAPITLVSFGGADGLGPLGSLIADANGDLFGTTQRGGANGAGTVFEIVKTAAAYASTPTTLVSFNLAHGNPNGSLIADANGDLFGTTESGGANDQGTVFEIADSGFVPATPTLSTLVRFNETNGAYPEAGLIADANGDLFGTTFEGGADEQGTAFEVVNSASGYANAPTTLFSFDDGADGGEPVGGLIADAEGDLFGTTAAGGADGDGTVFEIAKTSTGYASSPSTLVSFNESDGEIPEAGLVADANGDLFGTTFEGGADGDGTVFEIAKTASGYANTPITLVSFDGSDDGSEPEGGLIADPNGDLFGTTFAGVENGDGTVFEIAKTSTGYASTPTTVVSFDGADGADPEAGLVADANGDLFGTTFEGGADGDGTVFEIAKTASGYANTPITLVSFNDTDGANPEAGLIIDANGDLFGTTESGGAGGYGTVFEIAKTASGYANTPTTLASFDGSNGGDPEAALVANAQGDLFGTTAGTGFLGDGAVFEITNSGYATTSTVTPIIDDLLWQNTSTGQASVWEMDGSTRTGGGAVSVNPGPAWTAVGMGSFYSGDTSDILWQSASTGQLSVWEMDENARTGGGAVSVNPGPSWKAVGTGDFNQDGLSDILFQNASTGQVSVWEMNGAARIGGGAVSVNPGTSWKAVGTGDFSDDGFSDDIVFQNTNTGQVAIWEMDGSTRTGGGPVSVNPGTAWQAIGTGDFYGDGDSDILFQNTSTGQLSIWEMDGSARTGGGAVSLNPGPEWKAIGTDDGGSDILFQSTSTGQTSIWEMNGTTRTGGGAVSVNPGTSWHAVGLS